METKRFASSSSTAAGERKKTILEVLLCLHEAEPEYYTEESIRSLMLAHGSQ
ncbi:unnamed protein product, partial [Ilex paraguariensis]